jgi:DUF1365 family protein
VKSCLYEGRVRHRRLDAVGGEFHYPLFMVYLDLGELPGVFDCSRLWSARGRAPAYFRRADYLGDPALPLSDAVRALLRERGVGATRGPVRLLTHLRYLGHCFNPVSFYYCFDTVDGAEQLGAVVAEVTNTPWGERHSYVLAAQQTLDHGSARVLQGRFEKRLHVSPLMDMDNTYEWRMTEPGERLAVHIASHAPGGEPLFDATLALGRREISTQELRRALRRYPLLTTRILARIYGNALRLRARGARWYPHPTRARVAA